MSAGGVNRYWFPFGFFASKFAADPELVEGLRRYLLIV